MMQRNWWTAITSRKILRREQMPTKLTESKAERCSVFSYSVLRSYYSVLTDSTWDVSTQNSLTLNIQNKMEIVLKRIAKKGTYTIGRLYLLTDASVSRNSLPGKNIDDKRRLVHTFDSQLLSSWRHARLHPRWGEHARRYGGGLPHLAAATHQRHDSGSRPRRKYLDYHPIDRVS